MSVCKTEYWRRVDAGLCTRCGRLPALPERKQCGPCNKKLRRLDKGRISAVRSERRLRRVTLAQAMRREGASYNDIARAIGCAKGSVTKYVYPELEFPSQGKTEKRKWSASEKGWSWCAWNTARKRSERRGIPFSISPLDILAVFPRDWVCPVFGVKMEVAVGAPCGRSPSLDKIIPERGYVPGNIAVISFLANSMKQNATVGQVEMLADWMKKNAAT